MVIPQTYNQSSIDHQRKYIYIYIERERSSVGLNYDLNKIIYVKNKNFEKNYIKYRSSK